VSRTTGAGVPLLLRRAVEAPLAYDEPFEAMPPQPAKPPTPAMPPTPESGPAPARSTWERVVISPDVELHVRRPLDRHTHKRVERLERIARELFEDA
jgi:hypothetical protein